LKTLYDHHNNDMAERIKETAKHELENLKIATTEGVKSGAYVYPFRVRIAQDPSPVRETRR
jgi:hypothetical protein